VSMHNAVSSKNIHALKKTQKLYLDDVNVAETCSVSRHQYTMQNHDMKVDNKSLDDVAEIEV
jgi:hypothetical protein